MDSTNKGREILQDVGDEDILCERLLEDVDAETLMNKDNFEIDTGPRDGLQGV